MFEFDMSKIDDQDLNDTIKSLLLLTQKPVSPAAGVPGEADDNIGFHYLLNLMSDEAERRNNGDIGDEITIQLPFGEMTGAHVWALLKFTGAVVVTAAQGEPSEMAQFFGGILLEIEDSAKKVSMATWN